MNTTQLRQRMERANQLFQQMDQIEAELAQLFGAETGNGRTGVVESTSPSKRGGKRTMSAAGRARIAAAARARWAKRRGEGNGSETSKKPARAKQKRVMSPEARAKIAAAQKRRWAKQKAGK